MSSGRSSISLSAIAVLLGYFFLASAAIAAVIAAFDASAIARKSRWPEATAVVDISELGTFRPFTRNGGGVVYFVRCVCRFKAYGREVVADIRSSSTRGPDDPAMQSWLAAHPPKSAVDIRFNPKKPAEAVFADNEALPMKEHPKDDLVVTGVAALAGSILVTAGRRGNAGAVRATSFSPRERSDPR